MTPEEQREHMRRIRERLEREEYEVDAHAVAAAIVARLRGAGDPRD